MLEHDINMAPSQFEAMFLSLAHTDEMIQYTLDTFEAYARTRRDEIEGAL